MSILTDFAAAAAIESFDVIGAEAVVIGGTSYLAILNEAETGREYDAPGFRPEASLRAVFRVASCPAGDLMGKTATARGVTYRVESQRRGVAFLELMLQNPAKS